MPGEPDLYVRARRALLDAADALAPHLDDRSIAHNSGVGSAVGAVTVSTAATASES